MEAVAKSRNLRTSARKLRQVADLVRGRHVESALGMLHGLKRTRKGARMLDKTLHSAIANLQNKSENNLVDTDKLRIKTIFVDGGPVMKRIRARAQGRAFRIHKKFSHLTVVVSDQ